MKLQELNSVQPVLILAESDSIAGNLIQCLEELEIAHRIATNDAEVVTLLQHDRYRVLFSVLGDPSQASTALTDLVRRRIRQYVVAIAVLDEAEPSKTPLEIFQCFDACIAKNAQSDELAIQLAVAARTLDLHDSLNKCQQDLARVREDLFLKDESLNAARQRFEEMFLDLPAACFTLDRSGKIMEWNRAAAEMFRMPAHEVVERPVSEVLSVSRGIDWSRKFVDELFRGTAATEFDWEFTRDNGDVRYLAGKVIALGHGPGAVVAAVSVNIDVTEQMLAKQRSSDYVRQLNVQTSELKRVNDRLSKLAVTDGLTGLINHRRFQEQLEESRRIHSECNMPFSLLLIDVDDFKRVNDDLGHQFGDKVLRMFAEVLSGSLRKEDTPARYGGEEFVVILTACDADAARFSAERILSAIRAFDWPERPIRASIGIATSHGPGTSCAEMIRQADAALYQCKRTGRDCHYHYDDLAIRAKSA